MVYMFIARITMGEGHDVKIGFYTSRSGKVPRNGVEMCTCNPFDLRRETQTLHALSRGR